MNDFLPEHSIEWVMVLYILLVIAVVISSF